MPPLLLRKPKEARDVHYRARLSYSHRQPRQQHSVEEREDGNEDVAAASCRRRRQPSATRHQPDAVDAPSPPNTSGALTLARKPRVGAAGPAYALSPMAHSSGAEAYFFHHFREWTCDGLAASSPGSADFWKHYVLPLATHDSLVRTTLAAVGAAHQLFVARGAPQTLAATPWSRKTDEMERATIQQYNTAISGMVARMSAAAGSAAGGPEAGAPSVETHIVLLCCVLFICFESLMGRYAESIRHFEAGARMLLGPAPLQGLRDPATGRHLADMFAHLGVEFSAFLDDEQLAPPLLSAPETYFGDDQAHCPFADLTEATTALRDFDLAYVRGGFSNSCMAGHPTHETIATAAAKAAQVRCPPTPPEQQQQHHLQCRTLAGLPSPETTPLGTPTGEHPMAGLFARWEARFEKTAAAKAAAGRPLSAFEARQHSRLQLQQRLWPVIFALDLAPCGENPGHYPPDPSVDAAWWPFLERAEEAAAPLIQQHAASGRPTFALDGDLVSALSLLVMTATAPALEQRGLALLKALHRREGVWDSAELVELHEAAIALGDALDDACPPGGGIPALAQTLLALSATAKPRFSPNNGLLRVSDYLAAASTAPTPEGKPGNRWSL